MVYLIIKELAHTAEDVIMSTSIIMKDMSVGSDVIYRANAIRALCRIIDVCLSGEAVMSDHLLIIAGHYCSRH